MNKGSAVRLCRRCLFLVIRSGFLCVSSNSLHRLIDLSDSFLSLLSHAWRVTHIYFKSLITVYLTLLQPVISNTRRGKGFYIFKADPYPGLQQEAEVSGISLFLHFIK